MGSEPIIRISAALLQQCQQTFKLVAGTDIYNPVIEGLDLLSNVDTNQYNPAVILMTDGRSEGNISQLRRVLSKSEQ